MDLLHLVDRLEELIAEAQKMPIGNRVIIDRRRLLDLIDQMRISVPIEVREAREIVSDRDRVLRDAEEESRIIVGRAEESASHLIEAHVITEAARERAQEIADDAELRLTQRVEQANDDIQIRIEESRDLARQQMQAADDYAAELLHRLDRQLQAFVGSVQAGIGQVEPERELPPVPYPGEFDPGPPNPGNFRSDDALGSLPEDDRYTEELTLTRHELPDMQVPEITLPEPAFEPLAEPESAPAPVVMAEEEPESLPVFVAEPPAVDPSPEPPSRFGNSIWGRSETTTAEPEPQPEPEPEPAPPAPVAQEEPTPEPPARPGFATSIWGRSAAADTPAEVAPPPTEAAMPEPIAEPEPEPDVVDEPAVTEQVAASLDSAVEAESDDTAEESATAEPEPDTGGGGPFSSLFNRPAADTPPPSAPTSTSSPTGRRAGSRGTNLPGDSGRLPGASSVPPPAAAGSRFGLFGRRDQPAASVDTDIAPAVGSPQPNSDTSDDPAESDEPSPATGFGSRLGRAKPATPEGGFEDLLAQARETAPPLPDTLPEDLAEEADSGQPAAVIDDFDNPPLDDDPIRGNDTPDDDRSTSGAP